MNNQEKLTLEEVYAGELWKATMIKNVLEDNNIQAFLQNSLMGILEPWVVSPGGAGAVKVVVSSTDYDKAMLLVQEFDQSKHMPEN